MTFLSTMIQKTLRTKPEKWTRLITSEESNSVVTKFCERQCPIILIIAVSPTTHLCAFNGFPLAFLKNKATFFVKPNPQAISKSTPFECIITGDMSPKVIEQLSTLIEQILIPLLSNELNYAGVNAIIASSVAKYVNSFKCIVQQVQGHVTGFTVLPIPPGVEKLCNGEGIINEPNNYDFFIKSAIEGCVYRWSVQINDILHKMVSDENHLQQNPLPSYELIYWTMRQNKLLHIYKQLRSSKARYMARILEKSKSAYFSCFKLLFKNIVVALAEANEVRLNVQFLNKYITRLEETEFNEYKQLLKQLMHIVFLIWNQCDFYDETKLIILLKQICNFIIQQAKKYLDPSTLFHTDIDEAMNKTKCCINTLNFFNTLFHAYKTNMRRFPRAKNASVKPWNFQTKAVFSRLNAFLERLHRLQKFFTTTFEFSKLEKVELGGSKGSTLMIRVSKLYSEFQNDVSTLSNQSLDVFESTNELFLTQFQCFQDKAVEMDLKLLTIVCEAFESCPNIESVFKMINVFDSFLEKETIFSEMKRICPKFLPLFEDEVNMIEDLCTENLGTEENFLQFASEQTWPPDSSAQHWINNLCSRVLLCLRNCDAVKRFCRTSETAHIEKKLTFLMNYLLQIREKLFLEWKNNCDKRIENGSKTFIFITNMLTSELSVNCSVEFLAVNKDLRYMALMDFKLSESHQFNESDILQKHLSYLKSITTRYNQIILTRKSMTGTEYNLIKNEDVKLETYIKRGKSEITWADKGLGEYISELYDLVTNIEQQITQSQQNLTKIKDILMSCAQVPLFHRKDYEPIAFDPSNDNLAEKYSKIVSTINIVKKLLEENKIIFGIVENNQSDWMNYIDLVDGIVLNSLTHYIGCSLSYIHEHMDLGNNLPPLFEARLIISDSLLKLVPTNNKSNKNFKEFLSGIIEDIMNVMTVVPRISQTIPTSYEEEISTNEDIQEIKNSIFQNIDTVTSEVKDFCYNFKKFNFLWLTDEQVYMENFLKEQNDSKNSEQLPKIEVFREKIEYLEKVVKELQSIETNLIFSSWFKLDLNIFKQTLLQKNIEIIEMLKEYLLQAVVTSLNNLIDFIKNSMQGFQQVVVDCDYQALVNVMGHILRVKNRQMITDDLFNQLHNTIELLKSYDYDIPEDINVSLQELPEQWNTLKKVAMSVKQQLGPLQASQVLLIREHINEFEVKINCYRVVFRKYPIFQYACDQPYYIINKVDKDIRRFEEEMEAIQNDGCLFEVPLPDFKILKQCRLELKMIKQLWDYVSVVHTCIEEWKTTPWREVDVENMDIECKKFAREFRMLDKEIKTWDTFLGLESTLKNIVTSLRAVAELQNPSIKERHWEQLLKNTKSQTVIDHNTILADLLALNLHECEEEVKTIVDKAVKEMAMEKVLRELYSTWGEMQFEVETHSRTGCKLLRVSEELVETLEEHQVQLQNLSTSKFIAFFLEEISEWQRKLSIADRTISTLCEIQRTWIHLESIFMNSEDIKKQLPEDTLRFAWVDTEFKKITLDMISTPNVMESTSKSGLISILDELKSKLVLCEKALAVYLESKRLHFPRFYFISAADLLDILSNQNQPEVVAKHLSKLFDSIARIQLGRNEDGSLNSLIHGMFARDGEYVEFDETTTCTEAAEVWLSNIQTSMRKTLRSLIGTSVVSYTKIPRDEWIFDYPAQASLTGSQIWWTREVNMAFHRLEEGYDGALRDYFKKQVSQLSTLISLLIRDLSKQDRQKVMTICTIDVHSRDVVNKLIQMKLESASAFQWVSQLRHRWCEQTEHCLANICDSEFRYSYEYLGNTPRLVITPLTDRCYVTLTQSLHLIMGGAPAGPAGTGKTETTKDLGRALGIMVYVFNCSEQMDYQSCGNIYKGLAQTGAWGCFDEFNRISVEVLSVIAVQVKSILDAIKKNLERFDFMGEIIGLVPTVGIFITMNPGYAGRTELPENLKALFRPCAMVVPDFELICEIMLVAEGFQDAKILARKFITLYTLCKELLSKQDHYDWGLRAIKSVLVVAGALKRGDPSRPEEEVLMRALRDFNVPKIVTDDNLVFLGLIGDLFPALEVPRKRDAEFERRVKQAAIDLKLQPEDTFVLKVVQLEELLEVRHSVFIVGNAGTGKTHVWKTLFKTYINLKEHPTYNDLDPKAVTNDELFGVINPATREWKDGLLSILMRDQANLTGDEPKWIVLDGDIDPMWIESLNTVMDDNKVLTLASNERIALTSTMRLLFEITNLKTATPATVSRAGILYINPQDLGWNSYVTSWIEKTTPCKDKSGLIQYFDKYIPLCMDNARTRFRFVSVFSEIAYADLLCSLLDCILTEANAPADCPKEWIEIYFVFCCVWTFGSGMLNEQAIDYRIEFTKWWVSEFKTVKFPANGTVFDYYIDQETKQFLSWSEDDNFELCADVSLQTVLVHTKESIRIRYFLNLLMEQRRPVMLVGNAGCGKTALINEKLSSLPENYGITSVAFNFYTTSEMLQKVLERGLEKKSGRKYAPPGNKRMIFFIDDINMPEVDLYGTVQPHTLIRQHLNYGHWYDRNKFTLKEIQNCQYISCMNPTAGSFTISPRLQRHFCVFAINFPGNDAMIRIYNTILSQHLINPELKFSPLIMKFGEIIVQAAIALHHKVSHMFPSTSAKFHYVFNLRDISNIFQGLLFTTSECVNQFTDFVRLWVHESRRVYGDKLIEEKDLDLFVKAQVDVFKKLFEEIDELIVFEEPNIYCHFAQGIGEPNYMPIKTWQMLNTLLNDAMASYNELVAAMNLVLFEDAMMYVCRINRILEFPRGSALLVGVGGSGKQSLSRLAAFISSLEVYQTQIKKGYSVQDFKKELSSLYSKTGLKNIGMVFLISDAQIPSENFLVVLNDVLASGEVPDLFSEDELENLIAGVGNEVKGAGMVDTRENCWKFFIDRVQKQLKIVLCFSPVGTTLRVRCRKFPAIMNCTQIIWFHEWPQEALISVSTSFLQDTPLLPADLLNSAARFMAHAHNSVSNASKLYLQNERRYNYTTPKSFLEQVNLYTRLLKEKTDELRAKIKRLENGLDKLRYATLQVAELKKTLAKQTVVLQEKNDATDALINVITVETDKVCTEKGLANEEEAKVAIIAEEVSKKQKDCEEDLVKAEPALLAAQEALNTLNKANLTELKSFGSPPGVVTNVTAAVMVLLSPAGKIPKDRSWKASKIMMAKVDGFLDALINYDKENIHPEVMKAIEPYLKDTEFQPDFVRSKSAAAAGLCAWVINIIKFYEVFCDVEPKRKALMAANAELAAAEEKLCGIKEKVASLEQQLGELNADLEKAMQEKAICQGEANATNATIQLANRLVGGLSSENTRWGEAVNNLLQQERMLPGDVLLTTAFISYAGCFTKQYRIDLFHKKWVPFLQSTTPIISITDNLDPLTILTDDTQIAMWQNEGLPSDRMSTENATILTNSTRWPLMIDPQLQGIKWVKQKYGNDLVVTVQGHKDFLNIIEKSLVSGSTVLIENIQETVEPVLDSLLGRVFIKRGKFVKVGDKEIEYNPSFRLMLHTKMANPHYKPELQAQTTLINFTVTRDGLEDQLLAEVVKAERLDLEELKASLTKQQNTFKIMLKSFEDDLLSRLSSAQGNLLENTELVENLETTKRTAAEIEVKVLEARATSLEIDEARERYRHVASRASLLYFILNDLNIINPIYQFSLKAFNTVFQKAISKSAPADSVQQRIENLIDCVTFSVFLYTVRGLFEKDKLIFSSQMTFQVLLAKSQIQLADLDFLLRFPVKSQVTSPVDFLSNASWGSICSLGARDEFKNLDRDIENSPKAWKKLVESECPEKEKFPQEWKNKTPLQRLSIMRALRPDRMIYAVMAFIEENFGPKYIENKSEQLSQSYEETSSSTPVFFILSPGVNPLKDLESLGKTLGFSSEQKNFHIISLGQGQEVVAEKGMEEAAASGHWVILQNIHLVKSWLPHLEKKVEFYAENSHPNYRIFMTAEPAPNAASHIIPQGILQSSIKITNEPPTGMQANLHKALSNFNQDTLEQCGKEAEFKAIWFALCYFHAVIGERKKFGPQGWNKNYPFNVGDLTISVLVLNNYLERNANVPWQDLRYLFGEIMYGGHITDDWDRKLCVTYLEELLQPDLIDGELLLAPGFPAPPNIDFIGYHNYIDDVLPPESPYLYGLHPNAEIGFLTTAADSLFKTVFEMQPRNIGSTDGTTISREEKVRQLIDESLDKLPEDFNMAEIMGKVEERTPYVIVGFQECERMNYLMSEIKRSLKELDLGLKGELTITCDMENLENALFLDQVPSIWASRAYPSLLGLTSWLSDLLLRIRELETWCTEDFVLPASVWLCGFFNPQSLLTAVMQNTARRTGLPLDKMCLQCDVTRKQKEDITTAPKEGANLHGLYMDGARWEIQAGIIMEARLKELFPQMPVIHVKAISQEKQETRNTYECPMYKTRIRGPTYVWTFNLKTKHNPSKWVLAGVALLLQV